MKELTFREKLEEKINESAEARENLYKNKEQNKIKLQQQMIEKIEGRVLNAVLSYASKKDMHLYGPIFFVSMSEDNYYIEDYYGKEMVLFDSIDEIKEFIEKLKNELDPGFVYDITEDENGIINKATIRFKYEYKVS